MPVSKSRSPTRWYTVTAEHPVPGADDRLQGRAGQRRHAEGTKQGVPVLWWKQRPKRNLRQDAIKSSLYVHEDHGGRAAAARCALKKELRREGREVVSSAWNCAELATARFIDEGGDRGCAEASRKEFAGDARTKDHARSAAKVAAVPCAEPAPWCPRAKETGRLIGRLQRKSRQGVRGRPARPPAHTPLGSHLGR